MNLRPFIVDDDIREQFSNLVSYAEKHPLSIDDILDTMNKEVLPVGDDPNHVINMPFGYRIVYSVENQPSGKVRHLSMSVDEDDKCPNMAAVQETMKMLGFKNDIENCYVKLENISPKRKAINVLEKYPKPHT